MAEMVILKSGRIALTIMDQPSGTSPRPTCDPVVWFLLPHSPKILNGKFQKTIHKFEVNFIIASCLDLLAVAVGLLL